MAKRKRNTDKYEEGTDAYERTHVDSTALNEVFEVIKRIRRGKGFVGPQYDWFDSVCPSFNVALSYNPSQTIVDESLREEAVEARDVLKPAADALYKIWKHVSHQLDVCEGNIKAYDLRRGFFCLPDELLSTVLEYAALREARRACRDAREDGESNEEKLKNKFIVRTVKSAVKLSHVCKRFRQLIIYSPCLWNRVFSGMGKAEMVTTCLERCRRGNAEVTLSSSLFESPRYWMGYPGNGAFIRAALEKAGNWGSFILKGEDEHFSRFSSTDIDLEDYTQLAKQRDFPHLKYLSVTYPQAVMMASLYTDASFHDAMHFYSSWTMPRLQSILVRNFIPVPFAGSGSLSSLHVTLHFDRYSDPGDKNLDAKSLVLFLSACPGLEKFTLLLKRSKYYTPPPASEARLVLSNVSDLELNFEYCYGAPIKSLFDAISFPKVSRMSLDIESTEEEKEVDMHFRDVFQAVFPNANAFPNLIDMILDVNCAGFWEDEDKRTYNEGTISVPFALMPKLKYLTLKTRAAGVGLIPEGLVLPTLRRVLFDSCYRMTKAWLVGFLRRMEAQGNLDDLSVTVDGISKSKCGTSGLLSREDIQKLITSEVDE